GDRLAQWLDFNRRIGFAGRAARQERLWPLSPRPDGRGFGDMKVTPLAIPDVLLFEPQLFRDERGLFFESFNADRFETATGLKREFPQDNHSVSRKGVLRGLHYQTPPFEQGKLVRVVRGAVFDVAVDIRQNSSTFG